MTSIHSLWNSLVKAHRARVNGASACGQPPVVGELHAHPIHREEKSGKARRPVSRVLSKGVSPLWMTIPLGPPLLTGSSCQPGSAGAQAALRGCPRARSLFGIAPGGACRAGPVARPAVGFYPTVSPLPAAGTPKGPGRRRSLLCGAFPGVAPAGRYPAPCLHGARTFLERTSRPRSSGHPRTRADKRAPGGGQARQGGGIRGGLPE